MPAAVETGLPPKVEKLIAGTAFTTSARPTTPARAKPLPMPLAKVIRSGTHVVRLVAPEVVAGTAPAGLHLVGDQQDAVLVEHLLAARRSSPSGGVHEAADALDRLGDQRGHVAGGRAWPAPRAGPRPPRRCWSASDSPAIRPRSRSPECSQDTCTGLSELADQLRWPVIAIAANERPW